MTKSALAFQPTPRPRPLTSAAEAERLLEATQDLGFVRPTAPTRPADPQAAPTAAPAHAVAPRPASPRKPPALKFDVPDDLWDELRMAALMRRVTVKYLVLEALEAKGYGVDLAAIPEDGRRLR
jgi:hypothetical protein